MNRSLILLALFTVLCSKASAQFSSVINLNPVPISASTADKPQSKIWTYGGKYWAVLANPTGTFLWQLNGTTWVKGLQLSASPSIKADCKTTGNITHILLFAGALSQLVSLEYDQSINAYKFWHERPTATNTILEPEAETATIDIDATGRMWVASDGATTINVRYSNYPYYSWSSPTTLANNVKPDDICGIIALPLTREIGVFWSNQTSQKFGFKTHFDSAMPDFWSPDELPAAQTAQNVGAGLADDHVNMVVSSNGTLFCATKTSYDTPGFPKIGLLVRRPSGIWDNVLYEVAQKGTRPIVILNEATGKLKVIYSSKEKGGNIVYKESPCFNIQFSKEHILIYGKYDNATSLKQTYFSDIVILASNSNQAVGILGTDKALPATQDEQHADVPHIIKPDRIPESPAIPTAPWHEEFLVYPNPATENALVRSVLPESSGYKISLYDCRGGKIAVLKEGKAKAAEVTEIELNGSKLSSGLYLINLETPRGSRSIKFTLNH